MRQNHLGLLPAALVLILWPVYVRADNFTFSYGAATQCDDFEVSWTGGVAPYHLTIVPSRGTPSIMDIPADAYTNGRGTFKTTMNHKEGQQVVAIMSDAGGFATGGVSPVITLGAQVGSNQCNTSEIQPDFFFNADSRLAQCQNFIFNGYPDAQLPIVIKGVVPGGTSFILNAGPSDTSFTWRADVASGTTLLFYMQDAQGRQGGSTQITQVLQSDDTSCLDARSPASVSNGPSMTATSTPHNNSQPSEGLGTGAIAGIIVAAIVGMIVVGVLIWFCVRPRDGGLRRRYRQEVDLVEGDKSDPRASLALQASFTPYDLYHPPQSYPVTTQAGSTLSPSTDRFSKGAQYAQGSPASVDFAHPPNSAMTSHFSPSARPDSSAYTRYSAYGGGAYAYGRISGYEPGAASSTGGIVTAGNLEDSVGSSRSGSDPVPSAAQRKAAQAGMSAPSPTRRIILHTDIEDELPPPQEEEVIELPPQYSERRRTVSTSVYAPESSSSGPSAPSRSEMPLAAITDPHGEREKSPRSS